MRQVIFKKSRTTRQLYKRVPLNGGDLSRGVTGFTSVHDGDEEIYFETSLDLDELFEMARKAAASKLQRSRDGAVIVKILERQRLVSPPLMQAAREGKL